MSNSKCEIYPLNSNECTLPSFVNPNGNWISVASKLPKNLETVWISNGKGWTTLGCLVYDPLEGYVWAVTNGIIYQENGKIKSECETDDDYEVNFWHELPKPLSI